MYFIIGIKLCIIIYSIILVNLKLGVLIGSVCLVVIVIIGNKYDLNVIIYII